MSEVFSLLWTQTWQIGVLALVIWLIVRWFAKERPHLAHALWLIVLFKCLTPPVFSCPTSPFSLIQMDRYFHPSINGVVDEPGHYQTGTNGGFESIVVHVRDEKEITPGSESNLNSRAGDWNQTPQPSLTLGLDWKPITLWIWFTGVAIGFGVLVVRYVRFVISLRCSDNESDARIDRMVSQLSRQLKLKKRPRVMVIEKPIGPAVLGLLRPTVLLPKSLVADKSDDALRPLLAHEMIHIRRGDLWWAMIQSLAKNLFWFHPMVWFAARMVTRESERSCDEETITCIRCRPVEYARGLLDVLEQKTSLYVAPALPGVRPVDITSARLERVMRIGHGGNKRTPSWIWLVMLIGAFVTLPGAAWVVGQESVHDEPLKGQILPNPPFKNPQLPLLPKASDKDPWGVATHSVKPLLKRIGKMPLDGQTAADRLISFLPVRKPVGPNGSSTPQRRSVQVSTEHGVVTLGGDQPTIKIIHDQLYVFENRENRKLVSELLTAFEKFGFKQVVVQVRFVTMPKKQVTKLDVQWSIAESTIGQAIPTAIGSQPIPSFVPNSGPLQSQPEVSGTTVTDAAGDIVSFASDPTQTSDFAAAKIPGHVSGSGQSSVRVTSFVEKSSPVLYSVLERNDMKALIQGAKGDTRTNILQAPTVTMFNGQNAMVKDCVSRPFVVGLNRVTGDFAEAMQPVIRTIEEGTSVEIQPMLINENELKLNCNLVLSSIRSVETHKISVNANKEPVHIQVPEVAISRIQSSMNVPQGKTLVLNSMLENEKGETESMLVLMTTQVIDTFEPNLNGSTQTRHGNNQNSDPTRIQPREDLLMIRSGDQKSQGEKTTVKTIEINGMKVRMDGDVQFEMSGDLAKISGKRLHVKTNSESGFELFGDQGIVELRGDQISRIQVEGNASLNIQNQSMTAEKIRYNNQIIQLQGKAKLEYNEARLQANQIQFNIDESKRGYKIQLHGEAILTHPTKDGSSRIEAEQIKWDPDSNKIDASGVGKTEGKSDAEVFSFFHGIQRY